MSNTVDLSGVASIRILSVDNPRKWSFELVMKSGEKQKLHYQPNWWPTPKSLRLKDAQEVLALMERQLTK